MYASTSYAILLVIHRYICRGLPSALMSVPPLFQTHPGDNTATTPSTSNTKHIQHVRDGVIRSNEPGLICVTDPK